MSNHTRAHVMDGVLATPVFLGFFTWLAGVSLQDWLLLLSIAYTALLIVQKLWQMRGGPIAAFRFIRRLFTKPVAP